MADGPPKGWIRQDVNRRKILAAWLTSSVLKERELLSRSANIGKKRINFITKRFNFTAKSVRRVEDHIGGRSCIG